MDIQEQAVRIGAALAVGALAGIERGWSLRASAPGTRVAGVRTLTLIGAIGGTAGLLAALGYGTAAAGVVFATAAVLAFGYWSTSREQADATSAVTGLLVLVLGFLAGVGEVGVALAAGAVSVLVLALRQSIHSFVARLDERDIKALARFSVLALAVLPFLPDRPMGPYDVLNPTRLWWVVVIVTGFSFAGYAANRMFGARHGTVATAVIGGAYSSTAVTQSLAERIRQTGHDPAALAGIALASAVMYLRVLVLVGVLAGRLLQPFALLIAPALAVQAASGLWLYRRAAGDGNAAPPGNPIAIVPALAFMLFVAAAAVAAHWAQTRFGSEGIAVLLFLMGTFDVDASIVTAGGLPASVVAADVAALALAGTVVANMGVKIGVTLAYAGKQGWPAAASLGASMLALAATIALAW